MKFTTLAVPDAAGLVFGQAPKPVTTRRGLTFGAGPVYPELNFTLPPMEVTDSTFGQVVEHYRSTVAGAIKHAQGLHAAGLVFEFETLLEMTKNPAWGVELVQVMEALCEQAWTEDGFPTAIRLTPNDLREFDRPPRNRTSAHLEQMWQLFDQGAAAGGDLLSIESTGGKEVHDEALMMCDLKSVIFALGVLGVRDMEFVWSQIVQIAAKHGRIAGGDTACGFGNTAMVLAEQGFIPRLFAALVRVVSVVRTLVAVEQGATGPDKDCGYEGPFLKAIAGIPISMEGRSAACAHFSPVGNVAACAADLWSNESVQDIKLLSGPAPLVSVEQLIYDTRLLNQATAAGQALWLRDLHAASDAPLDPQAFILMPASVIEISRAIVAQATPVAAAVAGATKALDLLETAHGAGDLLIPEAEEAWFDLLRMQLEDTPTDEGSLVEEMLPLWGDKFIPEEYGL